MVVRSSDASPGATVLCDRPTKCVVDDIWLYQVPGAGYSAVVTMPDGIRYLYQFFKDGSFKKELFA